MLQKSIVLCLTSFSWLFNARRAFLLKKTRLGVVTTVCSLVSMNLWRDYDYNNVRRTADICVARVTGVYYGILFVYRWTHVPCCVVKDVSNMFVTNTCYLLSSHVLKHKETEALMFHSLFHVGVFNLQHELVKY